ncbi:MAG: tRNA 5-hydroxyuridine modification protein YegQ [Psittacicella sp.]
MSFKPELLSPAGSLKNMRYAFAYGADAVYAGQPRYSLRVRNNEFNHKNLEIGINEAHSLGKQFYIVVNIAPHNSKLKTLIKDLKPVIDMKPDALIISDPGIVMMVQENFPEMPIHLSVQANTVNWASVKFWEKLGVQRIILSRELSLDEIREIKEKVPAMELEVFIHGALCMAYSGRCLLSGYINKRDSNQGTCTNACRWKYDVSEGQEDEVGQIIAKSQTSIADEPTKQVFLLKEDKKEDPIVAYEDEHGTYMMNSKDLRALEHIPELMDMQIDSIKIEGRTKSFFYCARTAQIYRKAIDTIAEGGVITPEMFNELDSLANRGYTDGFLKRHSSTDYQTYEYGYSVSNTQQFVGEFTGKINDLGWYEVAVKNKFLLNDSVEIMTPKGNITLTINKMLNRKNQEIDAALGDGHFVFLNIDSNEFNPEYALVLRNLVDTDTRNPFKKESDHLAKEVK